MSPSCWCWCCCCCLIAFCSVIVISSPTSSSPHTQKKETAVPRPNYSLNTHPLPFSLPPARSAPHQKHDRKKVDTQTLPQAQPSRQARCCRKGNNDKLTQILQTLILQIRNIIIVVIIIRKQTHQRVRTVAHSQKLPTRIRSRRSRHASRCIPSTSMRRVESGATPASSSSSRPTPQTPPTSLLPIFLPLCWVPSTCSRSWDDSCAIKRRWRRSPRRRLPRRRRACASRRPDVRPGFRATDRNQSRLSQFLGPKERRLLDADPSPTAGRRFFLADRWTQSHSNR